MRTISQSQQVIFVHANWHPPRGEVYCFRVVLLEGWVASFLFLTDGLHAHESSQFRIGDKKTLLTTLRFTSDGTSESILQLWKQGMVTEHGTTGPMLRKSNDILLRIFAQDKASVVRKAYAFSVA